MDKAKQSWTECYETERAYQGKEALLQSVGSVIGLLEGATRVAIGAVPGLVGGTTADLNNARIGDDFIDDVTNELLPNRFAMVAEIEETWTTPVDCRMKTIGGTVFRRAISDVNSTVEDEHIAAIKAEPLIGVNAPW